MGEDIEVGGIAASLGMGVCDGKGDGASGIYFGEEAFGKEAVRVCERGGNDVREGLGDGRCQGMCGWSVPDGIEAAGCVREGGQGYCTGILFARQIVGRGRILLAPPLRGLGGFSCLSISWEVFWSEVGVEGARREGQQVMFSGVELFSFPRVGEGPSVELGVAEHFLE